MSYLKSTKQSLDDLHFAVSRVVSDAWRQNPKQLFILGGFSILLGLLPYLSSGALAIVVNELISSAQTGMFETWLIALVIGLGVTYFTRDLCMGSYQLYRKIAWTDRRQHYELDLTEKLASLDIATHESPTFQDEVNTLREKGHSFLIANFLDSLIMNGQNVAGVVTASAITLAFDWRYFALILVACVPQFYVELRYGRGLWSIYQGQAEDRRLYHEMQRHATSERGVRELQTFQTAPYFLGRQREMLSRFLDAQKSEDRKRFRWMLISQVVLASALITILFMLVRQTIAGEMQIGTFSFVLSAVMGLEGTVTAFLVGIADQRTDARAVAAYYTILRRQPAVLSPVNGHTLTPTRAPVIEFKNVTFSYPGKPDEPILKNLSLKIGSGERLAIIGLNGAGKTTLIKLLCRFYDPTEGAILIDGVDLRTLDLESWYRHLALLSQDYEKYQLKVWELIRLGRYSDVRQQPQIEEAARRTQADLFINAWKGQYDQQLGNEFVGGTNPSGGQWQKLALTRTLFRDAFVTVLDEPTAHVDPEAEQHIFESLQSDLRNSQTLVLISHRFSTVRKADRICVLKNGAVAELGSHLELVHQRGIYAGLFEKQAAGYQ